MTVSTWEEAANAAANTLELGATYPFGQGIDLILDDIDWHLDRLRTKESIAGVNDGVTQQTRFQWIAQDGLAALLTLPNASSANPRAIAGEWVKLIVATVISKQHDYGHGNVLWGGVDGLAVRLHDKTARIRNLNSREAVAKNESITDSWTDVVGYGIVGMMLCNGTFELPLACDLPLEAKVLWYGDLEPSEVRTVSHFVEVEQPQSDVVITDENGAILTTPQGHRVQVCADQCGVHVSAETRYGDSGIDAGVYLNVLDFETFLNLIVEAGVASGFAAEVAA